MTPPRPPGWPTISGRSAKATRRPRRDGPPCQGVVEEQWHLVDIAGWDRNGGCGCEYFEMCLEPLLSRMAPNERAAGPHRCRHIHAARDFALDLSLASHEHLREARA